MSILSEKSRRLLRKIYRGVGAAAITVLFQACYGGPMDRGYDVNFRGRVRCKDTNKAIPDIQVSSTDSGGNDTITDKTWDNGEFSLYVPWWGSVTLEFTDIDGAANGLYKPFSMKIQEIKGRDIYLRDVYLEPEE